MPVLSASLGEALDRWGKYSPSRVRLAQLAYLAAVELWGAPWIIQEIDSHQYVAVAWANGINLTFYINSIRCKAPLSDEWVLSNGWDRRWYVYWFTGGERGRPRHERYEETYCPNCPGLLVPKGTECPYCGTEVA